MPQIDFTIDKDGKLTSHIQGIQGPQCDDIAKLLKQLLGNATDEKVTPEYYQQPRAGLRQRENA